jgi:hypothetical protein
MQSQFIQWKKRHALKLDNGTVQAVFLAGGGHLAELRLLNGDGASDNLLWEAPWTTVDPDSDQLGALGEKYGGPPAGPFLAGFTGHTLCLDTFGPPSKEYAACGIPLHGEASARTWQMVPTAHGCTMQVELPSSLLRFSRTISLMEDESALLIEENLDNYGAVTRDVHWVHHVTFGPPLLNPGYSSLQASVDACRTWPLGYEGKEVLPNDVDFSWPLAPTLEGSALDLRFPFQREGKGFLAAARVHPSMPIAYVAALNWQLGLALIYCFRREEFPWVTIWEESQARTNLPWNGTAQARGMEFGTTPMPLGSEAIRSMGTLFDTPLARVIPAGGKRSARYVAAIAAIPADWREVNAVEITQDGLMLIGAGREDNIVIVCKGAQQFLTKGCENA